MGPRLSRLLPAAVLIAASLAAAQTPPPIADEVPPPPSLPPPPEIGPAVEAPPPIEKPKPAHRDESAAVVAPPPPPVVLRSPVAVLQVLDKVTAETLRFEAPVGRRVRYKTLVVEVKACETRGYNDPQPRASAYIVVDSRTAALQTSRDPTTTELFHGWTFAFSPALHAVEHPLYDLWLVACSAAAPTV